MLTRIYGVKTKQQHYSAMLQKMQQNGLYFKNNDDYTGQGVRTIPETSRQPCLPPQPLRSSSDSTHIAQLLGRRERACSRNTVERARREVLRDPY